MDDMKVVNGGLAWGVPVQADMLGEEAYEQVQPTLQALRLCLRFGKGSEVYVTKLPKEIEELIEETLLEDQVANLRVDGWTD